MNDQTTSAAELTASDATEKKPSSPRKKSATSKKSAPSVSAKTNTKIEKTIKNNAVEDTDDSAKKAPAKKTSTKTPKTTAKKTSKKDAVEVSESESDLATPPATKAKKVSPKKSAKASSSAEMEETKEARAEKTQPTSRKKTTKTAVKSTKKSVSVEKSIEVTEGIETPSLEQDVPQKNNRGKSRTAQKKSIPVESEISFSEKEEIPSSQENTLEQTESEIPQEEKESQGSNRRRGRRGRGRGKKNTQNITEITATETLESSLDNIDVLVDTPEDLDELQDGTPQFSNAEKSSESTQVTKSRRKMFVSVLPDEQVEVALCEEGQVQEYYVEMLQQAKVKGNIYKAVIHNVDANLQAAFVNYGAGKNGFLQIDEVHPEYYNIPHDQSKQRKYPPIQKVLKPGQEVLVQIVKEPTGNKGAFLTTYISFAGRFLVLTPGREQVGVSRKVDDEKERARLREMLNGLSIGSGLGVIVRTVSMGASKANLHKDLQALKKLWKEVRGHGVSDVAPSLIYQEMDLTTRSIRDYLTDQVTEVWIDDEKTADSVAELAKVLFPKKRNLVRVHKDESTSLFERFNVQRQLDQIHSREVVLPSGGRLVIDPTEALTAIDINSGRSGGKNTFEDMAYRTNMEAAKMIPLQLRLRDIGGQIVADFIEMRDKSHWREVEKTLRQGMKVDRARYDVGKIGPFGMMEIVRQRLGTSAISVSTEVCPCCKGSGVRRNMEWQSQQIFKDIQRQMRVALSQKKTELVYEVEADLAFHLLNQKRQRICDLEQLMGITLVVLPKN